MPSITITGESVSQPVVQEETTGCGIASVANLPGKTYSDMKAVAGARGRPSKRADAHRILAACNQRAARRAASIAVAKALALKHLIFKIPVPVRISMTAVIKPR
ncbi:hypothetical protein ERE07_04270 [Allopusillimonas ginsengisoli]|nr:hypothetical protein ERE07_04270 [Allopusillimonas ginsengisoli]